MFGFEGWLVKVNGAEIPTSLIQAESYKITPDQETDCDDYTDSVGVFHRNVLPAKATKIEFNIKHVRLADKVKIAELIPVGRENKLTVDYWNDRQNKYMTGTFYCPAISYEINIVYRELKDILYNPTRIALIEYGEERE